MPSVLRDRFARAASTDAGFTVLEALVSFVLLAVVAGGATAAVDAGIRGSSTSSDRSAAANLAQQDLQAADALRYPNYPTAATRTVTIGSTTYTVQRSVSSACPATPDYDTNAYEIVTATVSWKPTSTANQVRLASELTC